MQEIEIPPRDCFKYYVHVDQTPKTIMWNFSTKRKNLSFGLYYQNEEQMAAYQLQIAQQQQQQQQHVVQSPGLRQPQTPQQQHGQQILSPISTTSVASPTTQGGATPFASGHVRRSSDVSNVVSPSPGGRRRRLFGGGSTDKGRDSIAAAGKAESLASAVAGVGGHVDTIAGPAGGKTPQGSMPELRLDPNAQTYPPTNEEFTASSAGSRAGRWRAKSGSNNNRPVREPYLEEVLPIKRYESGKATIKGHKTVTREGTYVLIFDNTFSRNTSKKMTYFVALRDGEMVEEEHKPELAGWLLKKKRKRMQGWAKRYFVSDRGHLAYFKFEAGFCRGSIPIALSTISVDPDRLIINIDSGSSLWHLRALSSEDYAKWIGIFKRYKEIQAEQNRAASRSEMASGTVSQDQVAGAAQRGFDMTASPTGSSPTSSVPLDILVRGWIDRVEAQVLKVRKLADASASVNSSSSSSSSHRPLGRRRTVTVSASEEAASHLATAVQDLSNLIMEEKQDLMDQLECEVSKSKSLQMAYADILRENTELRNRLGMDVNVTLNGAGPLMRTYSQTSIKQSPVWPGAHLRAASVASTGSDKWFDAEEIVISAPEESSDEDGMRKRRAHGKQKPRPIRRKHEDDEDESHSTDMLLNDEEVDEEDEEDDDDSDYSDYEPTNTDGSLRARQVRATNASVKASVTTSEVSIPPTYKSKEAVVVHRRQRLPAVMSGDSISLLGILRKNVGKDLSTVTMPISLNEPINLLQKLCEELEYSDLLDRAASSSDSLQRLQWVAAFAITGYSSTAHRTSRKPFNPLHGETYECVRPDKGFKFVSEKVSHQPPIMACHATGTNWSFCQDSKVKTKFWGKSMEFIPSGNVHVTLPSHGDHFTWTKVTTCMRNLIGGPTSLDHYGKMVITNHATKERAEITFKENGGGGWLGGGSGSQNEVVGSILDRDGNRVASLRGRWCESIYVMVTESTMELLWKANPPLPDHEDYYGFTQFTVDLNEITPDIRDYLPPTDTRLRPDQRLFEEGDVAAAEAEKTRLEEKQRAFRRQLEAGGRSWVPQWFEPQTCPVTGAEQWTYRGGYWETRETRKWPRPIELW